MRILFLAILLPAMLVLMPVTAAYAHSPVFPEGNHDPSSAYDVGDPEKSWAIYTTLESESIADYYTFTISQGERIQVSLIVPESPAQSGFSPSFTIMGPGINRNDKVPDYMKVPPGYGTIVIDGTDQGQAVYEPFSPGWFYEVGAFTQTASVGGTYYVAVFNPEFQDESHSHEHGSINYAVIIGYFETFTPRELVLIPYRVNEVYVWEGQNRFIIILPILLTILVGGLTVYWRSRRGKYPKGTSKWMAAFGGLTFIGSAVGLIYQMLLALSFTGYTREAVVTIVIILVSIILGIFALLYALRDKPKLTVWRRVVLVVIGAVALFAWSGFYLGPALLITAAFMPPYTMKSETVP